VTRQPSAWRERRWVALAALAGFGVATYLALVQLGVLPAWDPLFGVRATRAVLFSALARRLPFPDAAAGAVAYLLEAVTVSVGGDDRGRERPGLVLAYAAIALGLGVAGVVLTVAQPLVAGAWCTLCLASAVISVALIVPALREARATVHARRGAHTAA
jgi:uncharacterized membrane protein